VATPQSYHQRSCGAVGRARGVGIVSKHVGRVSRVLCRYRRLFLRRYVVEMCPRVDVPKSLVSPNGRRTTSSSTRAHGMGQGHSRYIWDGNGTTLFQSIWPCENPQIWDRMGRDCCVKGGGGTLLGRGICDNTGQTTPFSICKYIILWYVVSPVERAYRLSFNQSRSKAKATIKLLRRRVCSLWRSMPNALRTK